MISPTFDYIIGWPASNRPPLLIVECQSVDDAVEDQI